MKIISYFKKNKLNKATKIFSIICIIIYIFALVIFIKRKYSISSILSMSADYTTIVTFVLVAIQVIAFVKDSRLKEFRSRKEYALCLAKEYANNLLKNMTYINTVFSEYYYKQLNEDERIESYLENLNIDSFDTSFFENNKKLIPYEKHFINNSKDIAVDTIIKNASIHEISDITSISNFKESDEYKDIANRRFISFYCTTMNELEYFAMSVNQNVAESDMLFDSLHQTYIKHIKYMYPYICALNTEKGEYDFYSNVIKLYDNWIKKKNEIDKIKLKEKEKTKKERKKISSQPL